MQIAFDSITSRTYVDELDRLHIYLPEGGKPGLSFDIPPADPCQIGALRDTLVFGVRNLIYCIDPEKLQEEKPVNDPECLLSTFDVDTLIENSEDGDGLLWTMSSVGMANLVLVTMRYPERDEVSINALKFSEQRLSLFKRVYISDKIFDAGDSLQWVRGNQYWVWSPRSNKFSRTDGKISFTCMRKPFYDEWHHVFYYISANYNICQLDATAVSEMSARIIAGCGGSSSGAWEPPTEVWETKSQFLQAPINNIDAVLITRKGDMLLRHSPSDTLCNLGRQWFDNAESLAAWLYRTPIPVTIPRGVLEIIHAYSCVTYYFESHVSAERLECARQMLISK